MAKQWWFKFDFKTWRTDSELRRCSLETRGFWLEVLCVMQETGEYKLAGTYEEIGWLIGCSPEVVARCVSELKRTGTADVTLRNDSVTLISRRLKRAAKLREQTRLRVQRLRSNGDVTQTKQDPLTIVKSNKKEVREEEKKEESNSRGEYNLAHDPPRSFTPDPRRDHPAIFLVTETTGKEPPKEIWDALIDTLGAHIDAARLRDAWVQWRARGFSKANYAWALEWYTEGIPENRRNGSNGTDRTNGRGAKATAAEIIANRPYRIQNGSE
jgi:hypothetical protein